MVIFKIDNMRMRIQNVDLDGDGVTGGVENVPSVSSNVHYMKDTTELGEALEHQNKDTADERGFNSVDFSARINNFQYAPLVAVDMVATMKVISSKSRDVVRHIMRKSVSLEGKGREEFVNVVTGKHDNDIRKASVNNLTGTPQK